MTKRLTNTEFLSLAKSKHGSNFEYLDEYATTRTKIRIKCNKCNNITLQKPSGHLQGNGCKKCAIEKTSIKKTLSIENFENRCKKIHNNKYLYHQDYTATRNKIRITCKRHKKDFVKVAYAHLSKKQGCPLCKNSTGENIIIDFLDKHEIIYVLQKRFIDCKNIKPLPFDFFIESQNLCIEFDGIQHFQAVKRFGGIKKFHQTVSHDNIKNDFCQKNNINLIRIKYNQIDKIEEILSKIKCK